MLQRKILTKTRGYSGGKQSIARGIKNVFIFAGFKSNDYRGAKVMRNLRQELGEEVNFYGVGGPLMEKEGLSKNIGDINNFQDKPFFPFRNATAILTSIGWQPHQWYIKYQNWLVLKQIDEVLEQKIDELNPDLFITLGNELFMNFLYRKVEDIYSMKQVFKPPTVFMERLNQNQRKKYRSYLDYILYTIPKKEINWAHSNYPSAFVGNQGVFNAWSFLYGTSERHKNLVDSKGIWINKNFNTILMENLIAENRERFRKTYDIGYTETVMFVSPGSDISEVNNFIDTASKGCTLFVEKYIGNQQISEANFSIVVHINGGVDADEIRDKVESAKWPCRLILLLEDDCTTKFEGICASDFGLAVNGDTIQECAALQLPTLILDNQNFIYAYWSLLYNGFVNDMNIAVNGEIFPELVGQNFPEKVAELWSEWYLKPTTKYDYIKRFTKLLPKMLAQSEEGTKEVTQEGVSFQKYWNPEAMTVNELSMVIDIYETRKREAKAYEIEEDRQRLFRVLSQ